MLSVSDAEQYFIYALNRARHDPAAYQIESGANVNLTAVTPRPPLAVNAHLTEAGGYKSGDMAARNYFDHTAPGLSPGGPNETPNELVRRYGYDLPETVRIGGITYLLPTVGNQVESLAGGSSTVDAALKGLIESTGHRNHLLGITAHNQVAREVGIGYAFQSSAYWRHYWTVLITPSNETLSFLTGVIFTDGDADSRFDATEGLGGVTVTATGPTGTFTTSSMTAGGWSLKVPAGDYIVSASGGGFSGTDAVPVSVGDTNVAVDFISGSSTGWINFEQFVNSAPTLDPSPRSLPPVVTSHPSTLSVPVDDLLGEAFNDENPLASRGIAITSASVGAASGEWSYSIDGGTSWLTLGSPSVTAAHLLRGHDLIGFVPTAGSTPGSASLSYRAWDHSTGSAGETADTSANGGSTAFSTTIATVSIATIAANTAPVLVSSGGGVFESVLEDAVNPAGTSVSVLVGSSLTDVDPGTPPGIAVTATIGGDNGTWEYSTDAGAIWQAVGIASESSALPLQGSNRLRFKPSADFNGTVSLTFRAWDQSAGRAGERIDLSSAGAVGGSTAFSTASRTASLAITPQNDAPEYLAGRSALRLRPVPVNATQQQALAIGTRIRDLLGNSALDVDQSALGGIAIIGTGSNGTFWWNTGSGGWSTIAAGPHYPTLLRDTDYLYFTPSSGFSGTSELTFRLWDRTSGSVGHDGDGTSNVAIPTGGTMAFGSEILVARVFVGDGGGLPTTSFGSPTRAADGLKVASIPITFSRAIEGFDIGDLTLSRNGTPISIADAELSGSGTSFQLAGLAGATAVAGSYTLTLAASSSGITDLAGNRTAANATVSFAVTAPPTDILISSLTIPEDRLPNTVVGSFTTTDPDTDDTFTYTLVTGTGSTDNAAFNISGNQLRATASLDFETKSSYSVRVRSTDQGGLFIEKAFTITVTNVNETPTDIVLSATSIAESAGANAVVGTLTTTDPDAGNTFTYTLLTGTGDADNAAFNISGNQLRATTSLDFETKSAYPVRLRSTDQGGLFTEKTFTITVSNVNEAPTDIGLSATSIPENAGANAVVGTLTTTDPDVGNTFTYTLVTGTGSTDNAAFNISGNQLRATASLDFETKSSYSVRVRSTDQGGLFTEKSFTITVTNDVSDDPTVTLAVSPAGVTEDGTTNLVYTFTRTGPTTNALTVNYTVGGTATLGTDYTGISAAGSTKTVTFAAGSATATVTVDPTADTTAESDETVIVTLVSGTGYTIGTGAPITGTITNMNLFPPIFSALLTTVDVARVNTDATGGGSSYPTFSPDGSKVVFVSSGIWAKNIKSGELNQITTDGHSPVLSPDGNTLAFVSGVPNLVPGDNDYYEDVFVKNLLTGALSRVSTASVGAQRIGDCFTPAFSPDGSMVAFASQAFEFVSGDAPYFRDGVFMTDLASGVVTPVVQRLRDAQFQVVPEAAGGQANALSVGPAFSPDGSKVAFFSHATNLVPGDTNGVLDVFVKDLASGAITRASTNATGGEGNGPVYWNGSAQPVFSPDGSRLAFASSASNLVPNDTNNAVDVFVKDLVNGTITRASVSSAGEEGNGDSGSGGTGWDFAFSPDGSKVVFASMASNLVPGDTNRELDVFAKDLASGAIARLSVSSSGLQSRFHSWAPAFSPDGSQVVFNSWSALVTDDTNGQPDVFVASLGFVLSVTEGTTSVATLNATDRDPGSTLSYSIRGTDAARFTINTSTGALQFATIPSFLWPADQGLDNVYDIKVSVSDGSITTTVPARITVTQSSNQSPTDIGLSASVIAENQPSGTAVGAFSTTDPDAGNTFTYTLVTGTGDTDNAAFNISGNQLRATTSYDFETKSSYSVRVRSTDQGGLFTEKTFTITVSNVNETPTDILLSAASIPENAGANAFIGTLTTTDPDAGNTFTYTLVTGTGSTDNAAFNILGNQLRATASFDFEAKSSYSIRVRSTDQGGLFIEKAFTIAVTNVNETPTDIGLSATSIPENVGANAVIGTLATTDPDAGDTFTYTLVTGTGSTDNAAFNTSGNQLRATASFDFETKSSYSVRIRSTDQGGLFTEKTYTITVTNVNDLPSLDAIPNLRILEDSGQQVVALTGIASGDEFSQPIRITATSSNPVLILNPTVTHAFPSTVGSLTFTPVAYQSGVATITVTVEDGGLDEDLSTAEDNSTYSQWFDVTVTPILAFDLTARETMLLYLVNQTRNDPQAWAERFSISLPQEQLGPLQPVVPNESLQNAAQAHSDDLLTNNLYGHTGSDGSSFGERALRFGYGTNAVGENAADGFSVNQAPAGIESLARSQNDSWFESGDHRNTMLTDGWTEFGGAFSESFTQSSGGSYWSWRAAEVFGAHDAGPFLVGVVFNDQNGDSTYNVGEGLGGVSVTVTGPTGTFSTTTMSAGAWYLKVPAGEYLVSASGGQFVGASSVPVQISNRNKSVDFISGQPHAWVNFEQHVNSAPSLALSGGNELPAVLYGNTNPDGTTVAALLGTLFSDPDVIGLRGIAITYVPETSIGTWQYSLNRGSTWLNLGSPTDSAARLLAAEDLVRFVPNGTGTGSTVFSYRAWDRTAGQSGGTASVTSSGGQSPFSVAGARARATVIGTNTAPTLLTTGGNGFGFVYEDALSHSGTTVAHLIGTGYQDPDSASVPGIALTALTGVESGTWSYSTDDGWSWLEIGSVSPTQALLLRPSDQLSFRPHQDQTPEFSATFRLWDQSSGRAGTRIDVSSQQAVGGASAYSTGERTVSAVVINTNDAPTLAPDALSLRLRPVAMNSGWSGTITTVSDLLGNAVIDPDPAAELGIALVGVGANGTAFFRIGSQFGWRTVSPASATLLRATDSIGFNPTSGFTGESFITFRLWDQTQVVTNLSQPQSSTGGSTAFSREIITARVFVGPAGDSPSATFQAVTMRPDQSAAQSVVLTFTEAVTGFDIGDLRLTRNGSPVALSGVTLSGTGQTFTVSGLEQATSAAGTYVLQLPVASTGISDAVGNPLTSAAQVTFSVLSPNLPPSDVALSSSSIAENAGANFVVGTFSTTDPNAGNTFTYWLVPGAGSTDNAAFNISGTQLRATGSLNFESKSFYSVWIRSTDQGGLFTEKPFTITVTDVNEAPTSVSLVNALGQLSETANTSTATRLADIQVSDDALGSNTLSLSGPDAASFEISNQGSLYLKAGVSLSYATKPTLSVTISARDTSIVGSSPVSIGYTLDIIPRSPHLTTGSSGQLFIDGQPVTYAGSPVAASFQSWTILEAAVIRGENILFAQHTSGRVHRLHANADWSLVSGLRGIGSAYSIYLPRSARGPNVPAIPEPEPLSAELLIPVEHSGIALRIDALGRLYADRTMLTQTTTPTPGVMLNAMNGYSPIAIVRENQDSTWRNTLLWQHRMDQSLIEWQFDLDWVFQGNSRTPTEGADVLELAYKFDFTRDGRIG